MDDYKEKKRLIYIDMLKIIAILMVIILHAGGYSIDFISDNSFKRYFEFLLMHKELEIKSHIKKIVKYIALLIIWSVIQICITALINGEHLTLSIILKNVLTTNISNKYTGVLWFLQSLISLYVVLPLIKALHDKDKMAYNYFFGVIIFFTWGINLLSLINSLVNNNYINLFISYINKFNPLENLIFVAYFMLGGYLYEYKDKIKENNKVKIIIIIIGLISLILSFTYGVYFSKLKNKVIAGNFNYGTIFLAAFILCLYVIISNINIKNEIARKIISSIGSSTLGIYFVHILVIRFLHHLAFWPNKKLLTIITTFVISYLLTIVLKKIPILKELVS